MMKLYVGERRTLEFVVSDSRHEEFSISQANYKITLGDDLVDSGVMVIRDKTLSCVFAPTRKGSHRITVQYTIGLDTMIDMYYVEVSDDNL